MGDDLRGPLREGPALALVLPTGASFDLDSEDADSLLRLPAT